MISLSNGKLRKKLFLTNKKIVLFFYRPTEKNLWEELAKQIGENM